MKLNLLHVAAHARAVSQPAVPAVPADHSSEPRSPARSAARYGLPPPLREARHASDREAPVTGGGTA